MSLTAPYDPDNIFARILRGELPCARVYEDDVVLAFLDLFPQAPGHTLVVPKVAARNLMDLPAEMLGPYFERVQMLAQAVRTAFDADGVTLMQFSGAAGGQTVFHLHVHLIPRVEGDRLAGHGSGGRADPSVLDDHARSIAAALAAGAR